MLAAKFVALAAKTPTGECYIKSYPCVAGSNEDRIATYVMVLLIMAFALVWEGLLELIDGFVPTQLLPVVNRVVMEFAELGLMSLLIYIPSNSTWFVNLSNSIWNDCNHLLHLIHSTHFLVLWATLTFLGFVILLMLSSLYWLHRWAHFEDQAQGPPDMDEVRRLVQRQGVRRWAAALWFGASTATEYRVLRECFVQEVDTDEQRLGWGIDYLPVDFSFEEYLKQQQANFYIKVVNIMASSWISLVATMGVVYGLMHLPLHAVVIASVCLQAVLFLAALGLQIFTVLLYECTAPQLSPDTVEQLESSGCRRPPSGGGSSTYGPQPLWTERRQFPSMDSDLAATCGHVVGACPPLAEELQGRAHFPLPPGLSESFDPEVLHEVEPGGNSPSGPASSKGATPWPSPSPTLALTPFPGRCPAQPAEGCLAGGNASNEDEASTTDASSEMSSPPTDDLSPTARRSTLFRNPSLALSATRGALVSFLPTVQNHSTPKGLDKWVRLTIQIILLYTGLNLAFFIDSGAAFLLRPCGLGGAIVSHFVFAVFVCLLLGIALSLLQTVRVHIMHTCLGRYKNYAAIRRVLRNGRQRALFPGEERQAFARGSLRTLRCTAKALFRQLRPVGQKGIPVLALRRFLSCRAEGLAADEDVTKYFFLCVVCAAAAPRATACTVGTSLVRRRCVVGAPWQRFRCVVGDGRGRGRDGGVPHLLPGGEADLRPVAQVPTPGVGDPHGVASHPAPNPVRKWSFPLRSRFP